MTPAQTSSAAVVERAEGPIAVLCVDDNRDVAEAVRIMLERAGGFEWKGWLPGAETLLAAVERERPAILILDIDMPGRSPFDALEEVAEACPQCRAVMFSGHVRYELINRALNAGAWGYVSKNDGEEALVQAVRDVVHEEIALSPEVRSVYDER